MSHSSRLYEGIRARHGGDDVVSAIVTLDLAGEFRTRGDVHGLGVCRVGAVGGVVLSDSSLESRLEVRWTQGAKTVEVKQRGRRSSPLLFLSLQS